MSFARRPAAQAFPPDGLQDHEQGARLTSRRKRSSRRPTRCWPSGLTVKSELTGANGQGYFESSVKGALLPGGAGGVTKFKGKLIAAKPPKNPKQLVLGITDATHAGGDAGPGRAAGRQRSRRDGAGVRGRGFLFHRCTVHGHLRRRDGQADGLAGACASGYEEGWRKEGRARKKK